MLNKHRLMAVAVALAFSAGSALAAVSPQEAAKLGVTNVYWMTHETNATARKLYDTYAPEDGHVRYRLKLS